MNAHFFRGFGGTISKWMIFAILVSPAAAPLAAKPVNTEPIRAGVPTLFGEVHGREMAANCGINVTAFALEFFRKP